MTLKKIFHKLRYLLFPTNHELEVQKWIHEDGDLTYRLNYDLAPDSVVMDIGGYRGQWASDIFSMHHCRIHVFEPVAQFAAMIRKRFEKNSNVMVYQFGLGGRSRTEKISISDDGSSVFRNTGSLQETEIIDVAKWLKETGIEQVDLMKINIEGGEFELLERLIETGLVTSVRDIQVQFHDISKDSPDRMARIQRDLEKTHRPTYQFKFVWENWRHV